MKYSEFLNVNASGSDYVFLIAEIGKNFIDVEVEERESVLLGKAIRLVEAAKEAGADAVKFQTHCVADEVLPLEFSSPHFIGVNRYRWVKRNEEATSLDGFWRPLKNVCQSIGIEFFSTPMSKGAAIKLDQLGVDLWKIGSADLSDYVLLNFLASTRKPIIVSSGMVSLQELKSHISTYARLGSRPAILYCVSKYPCQPNDFNMATIKSLTETYPENVIGFSDHSVDSHFPALCAVKLGARIVEKHFSLDRNAWGSDHKASLMPHEYAAMVKAIRMGVEGIEVQGALLGELDRELEGATNVYRKYFEKGLVIASPVLRGDRFEVSHLSAMRPQMHIPIPASELFNILGAKATRDISIGEILTIEMIESHR